VTQALIFMPAARVEVIEAREWYNKQVAGLGARFLDEVDHQAGRITANPFQFPIMLADVRRARLRRFPHGLFFRALDDAIYVLACFHPSRDPLIWQNRVR
jgi:hypothetical protein